MDDLGVFFLDKNICTIIKKMLDFGSLVSRVIKSTWLFQCKILRK